MQKKDDKLLDYLRNHPYSIASEIVEGLRSSGGSIENKSIFRILNRLIGLKIINWGYHQSSDFLNTVLGQELAPKVKSGRFYQPKYNKTKYYWARKDDEGPTDESVEEKIFNDAIIDIKLKQKQGYYLQPGKISYGKIVGRFKLLMKIKTFKEAFEMVYLTKKCKDCKKTLTKEEINEFYEKMRSTTSWMAAEHGVDYLCGVCLNKRVVTIMKERHYLSYGVRIIKELEIKFPKI